MAVSSSCPLGRDSATRQSVDQRQEDFVGSEPFGTATVQEIDPLLRQPVHGRFDECRLADSGLTGDEGDLSLSGQHPLRDSR